MAFGKGPWRGLAGWCGQILEQQFPRLFCQRFPGLFPCPPRSRERLRCTGEGRKVPAV